VDLKKAIKRVNYQMPTLDEILPELTDAKVFTTLDARTGFWQLCLWMKNQVIWQRFGRHLDETVGNEFPLE
jgi:hypothetical protein